MVASAARRDDSIGNKVSDRTGNSSSSKKDRAKHVTVVLAGKQKMVAAAPSMGVRSLWPVAEKRCGNGARS